MNPTRDYEILYDLPAGEYQPREIGGICTRTIRSGALLEVMSYPITRISADARREARRRETGPAQARLNARNTQRHMERLLEVNFQPGDHVLTLTYAYPAEANGIYNVADMQEQYEAEGLPWEMEDVARDWRNYIARVRRALKRAGGDVAGLKYIYVFESGKDRDDGLPPHFHVHAVIHAPELSDAALRTLWRSGFVRCDGLELRFNGAQRLSRYLSKQRRYERRWGHSRGLRMPEERVSVRKMSRRRAAMIAQDVQQYGVEIMERLYPAYRCDGLPEVRWSDFVAGAYIYARMRRRD